MLVMISHQDMEILTYVLYLISAHLQTHLIYFLINPHHVFQFIFTYQTWIWWVHLIYYLIYSILSHTFVTFVASVSTENFQQNIMLHYP